MSKRHYLELMGIDVWQKRSPRQAVQQVPEQPSVAAQAGGSGTALLADVKRSLKGGENESKAAPVVERVVETPAPVAATEVSQEPAPEFYLTFSHFAGLTMVNVYPGGFAAIPGNHQRFLNTLYYALTGEKRNSEFRQMAPRISHLSFSHVIATTFYHWPVK